MMEGPQVPVLAVVGVGLIGGSFAAGLKRAGQVGRVIGVGRNPDSLARAVALGLIDEALPMADAVAQADLVMLAMPVGATRASLEALAPHLRPGAIVTDAGSTKGNVVDAARDVFGAAIGRFVPGHPIAGSERSGPDAARADLFEARTVILTPLPENAPEDVAFVARAWEACGALLRSMEPAEHDVVLASVSHVPHLLSFAYMAQVAGAPNAALRLELAGSGFKDFTRIAASSPAMWRDIFLANRDAVLAESAAVRAELERFERIIRAGDGKAIEAVLEPVSALREGWRKPAAPVPSGPALRS